MSVTAAQGFAAAGVSAGIRPSGKPDVALVRATTPAVGCAMWTTNRVQAAPVVVSRRHLALAEPQAVVVNAGVANAATGKAGEDDATATAAHAAAALGLATEQLVVLSTGVIGPRLPMDKLLGGVDAATAALSPGGGPDAAEAILTTDAGPKTAVAPGDGFTVGGMAKGAGMIHPCLATMLAVVTTDYPLAPGEADAFLRPAVERSFNRISVDGDCSTNDAVVLLARAAAADRDTSRDGQFAAALEDVCADLARQIVADGEGATVVLEIVVSSASSREEA
jgi:glutamate N-acetyltransferase/amino-acid N-acetyltransferase